MLGGYLPAKLACQYTCTCMRPLPIAMPCHEPAIRPECCLGSLCRTLPGIISTLLHKTDQSFRLRLSPEVELGEQQRFLRDRASLD